MNDSKVLNENVSSVANTPYEEEVKKPEVAQDGVVIGEVISTNDKETTVKFGEEQGIIPTDKIAGDVSVGDTIKFRIEKKDGVDAITEIISHEMCGSTAKPEGENADQQVADAANEESSEANDEAQETDTKPTAESKPKKEKIELSYIDPAFLLDVMSVPTHSKLEYRMVAYIIMWARRNNITYEFDEFGNIYLTKGTLDEGEFYPCVTSHLDTVQYKHDPYIYAGVPLELEVSPMVNQGVTEHKVSVNNEGGSEIGIGADDKGGICICLSMFDHVEKLKACFFLDEETGCHGSDHLEEDWFKDVGYVIGFDSPDLYRAAWACDGTQLFSYDFYNKHMKSVCDSWGLTKGCFFSEPYTDVKNIREKTDIICMNFGNGGYNAHNIGGTEYCIMEHMDQACGMGIDLIEAIGNTRHILKHKGRYSASNPTYNVGTDGYTRPNNEILLLEQLGDNTRKGYKPSGSTNTNTSTNSSSTTTTPTRPTVSKDDEIKFETVKYITEKYDSLIENIKGDVLETVKALCESTTVKYWTENCWKILINWIKSR